MGLAVAVEQAGEQAEGPDEAGVRVVLGPSGARLPHVRCVRLEPARLVKFAQAIWQGLGEPLSLQVFLPVPRTERFVVSETFRDRGEARARKPTQA